MPCPRWGAASGSSALPPSSCAVGNGLSAGPAESMENTSGRRAGAPSGQAVGSVNSCCRAAVLDFIPCSAERFKLALSCRSAAGSKHFMGLAGPWRAPSSPPLRPALRGAQGFPPGGAAGGCPFAGGSLLRRAGGSPPLPALQLQRGAESWGEFSNRTGKNNSSWWLFLEKKLCPCLCQANRCDVLSSPPLLLSPAVKPCMTLKNRGRSLFWDIFSPPVCFLFE